MERFLPKICRLSFYTEQNTSSSCKATGYFCTVIFTLATIGTIPFVAFTLPTVPLFTTCEDFASNVSSVFPSGVEILWANHTVQRVDSNMNNDDVVIDIPQIFLDIWTRDMVYPFSNPLADTLEMGMDYLDPDENMTSRFTFLDPYPRHIEFKVNDALAYDASSVPKTNHNGENSDDSSWQTLVSRSHQQEWKGGKVLKVFGNQSLDHYSYLVQPLEQATRKPINVSALSTKQLTSTVRVILDENRYAKFKNQFVKFHRKQGEFSDIGYDLNSELVVIGPKQFIVLQGYSYLHHSYWEYVQNSQDSPSSRGLFQKNQIGNLQGYKPLHFGAVILCKQTVSGEGEIVGVRCSRKIANENIMEWCKPWTVLAIDVGVPVTVLLINFISLLLNQTTTHIILFTLPVYIVGNLLRHVDTPSHSFVQVSNLCVYTSIPYVILENLCMVLYKLSSTTLVLDEDLKELLHECIYHWKVYTVWLLWTIICLIHCRWSKYSNDFVQDGATLHQKPNIATKPKTTEANADELFEPSCRICFSGIEEGILISPCLCTGSMHFVHISCLNQWRSMSANPKSLHRCEQCSFAYSISRTKIAYVVRSALAVHLLAVLSFLGVVLFTAAGLAIVDNLVLKGTMSTHWVGHQPVTNQPTSKIQSIQELATLVWEDVDLGDLVVEFVYGRKLFGFIDLFHVMGSVVLVGLFGFFTMNYYNIPFLLIRDVGRPNGNLRSGLGAALIVAVILGCVSLVTSLYGLFKSFTGKLLQSVEQRILEVGESYDEYETRRLSLLEAKQDVASNVSSGLENHAHNNQYSGINNNKSAIESQEDTSSSKQEVAGIGERDNSVLSRAPSLHSSYGVLEESGIDSQDTDHHQIYESISTTAVSDEETDLANVAQLGLRLRKVN